MTKVLDFCAARLPLKPAAYFYAFIAWGVALWFLSEGNPAPKGGPEIPHIDKVVHFGYFFGGGGLLSAYLGMLWWKQRQKLTRKGVILLTGLICTIIGRLDEYHQSFNPARSGNDTGDWIADILGGFIGAWVFLAFILPRLLTRAKKTPNHAIKGANSLDS